MEDNMNFSDILASTLHDTKNSLGILFNNLEDIIATCKEQKCPSHIEFYKLQYEIKRLNSSLIRLLSLYKADKSQLAINIDYHSISEFLDDVTTQHEILLDSRGIEMETQCDEELFWAFDRNLLTGVFDNVINNSFRYAKQKVRLSAFKENGYLVLRIEDDGVGYPSSMVFNERQHPDFKKETSFATGSTGLGIYFSLMVASQHKNREKCGFISIINGGKYGGGVFSIFLP
ncbi:MAG TPA: HAMP domain-containing sensor histidine kinase [Smithellaceae bacterium]|nr:HAMP domain-containing sensor histidine kinase [Smithellaceae bacterium]